MVCGAGPCCRGSASISVDQRQDGLLLLLLGLGSLFNFGNSGPALREQFWQFSRIPAAFRPQR